MRWHGSPKAPELPVAAICSLAGEAIGSTRARIETAMIWPNWLDCQQIHRWLRDDVEFAANRGELQNQFSVLEPCIV
jgi:hypothetical protein